MIVEIRSLPEHNNPGLCSNAALILFNSFSSRTIIIAICFLFGTWWWKKSWRSMLKKTRFSKGSENRFSMRCFLKWNNDGDRNNIRFFVSLLLMQFRLLKCSKNSESPTNFPYTSRKHLFESLLRLLTPTILANFSKQVQQFSFRSIQQKKTREKRCLESGKFEVIRKWWFLVKRIFRCNWQSIFASWMYANEDLKNFSNPVTLLTKLWRINSCNFFWPGNLQGGLIPAPVKTNSYWKQSVISFPIKDYLQWYWNVR